MSEAGKKPLQVPERGKKTSAQAPRKKPRPTETGGPAGLEPTRYGDWEKGGRCIDF